MTKKELVEFVMGHDEELSKAQSERIVSLIFNKISDSLSKGHEVSIAGFGKFSLTVRPAREGINPATKEKIQIQSSKNIKFKIAKQLKENIQ